MKRTVEDILKTEYKKYYKNCNSPKTFFDWASDYKTRKVASLKEELEKWEAYEPKKLVIIKVKKPVNNIGDKENERRPNQTNIASPHQE